MKYDDEAKQELAKQIASLIVDMSVADACKQVGLGESTFYRWLAADEMVWEHYARAREALSFKGESEIEKINDDLRMTRLEPQQAKVLSDNVKWLMGRRNQKVYGDKQVIDHQSKGEKLPVAEATDAKTIAEAMRLFKESL